MMYPASFLFREASTAFVVLILLNLFLGITCTVTVSILQLFPSDPVSICSLFRSFIGLSVCSSVRPFLSVRSFDRLFIRSFVRSFVRCLSSSLKGLLTELHAIVNFCCQLFFSFLATETGFRNCEARFPIIPQLLSWKRADGSCIY